jgi:D-inositol-3-phosphate glycosyltransferase
MLLTNPTYGPASLRIAMLSVHSSPVGPLGASDTGGMSVYVRELSRWLGAAGHAVDIFTSAGPHHPERSLYPNVRLIHLGKGLAKTPPKDGWLDLLPLVFEALDAYAGRQPRGYDIIHSHYWLSGVVGAMAQARWRRPHLTMFHTLGAVKNSTQSGENESHIRIAHEQWLAMATDRIIVAAPREQELLAQWYHAHSSHTRVIPCGVNRDLFRPVATETARRHLGIAPDAQIVLYVGRFAPLKGVDRLVAAVSALRPRFPKLQLLIVGGDGPRAGSSRALTALAARLGIADAVTFKGRIEHQDLPPYYSAADLLAMPSYYESFGLVVLEALACGTPVVATPVGVAPAVIREGVTGTLVAGADPRDIAEGIARILGQPAVRRPDAASVRAAVQDYGWPRVARVVAEEYAQLLAMHDPTHATPAISPGGWPNENWRCLP